ncbi:putative uncharacterized protein DDB_G0292292 isoform X1 [Oppia nitens]|uniref:putative uncharacterized protein DDB_G0292292 isoform X1 n=1 Tax=Oppia nitens TaxID=1686743 RepID=UPI0023DB4599|nr:putative uncharacterized protein DDB_G0292292 isoform X1 [Oppia nitens]
MASRITPDDYFDLKNLNNIIHEIDKSDKYFPKNNNNNNNYNEDDVDNTDDETDNNNTDKNRDEVVDNNNRKLRPIGVNNTGEAANEKPIAPKIDGKNEVNNKSPVKTVPEDAVKELSDLFNYYDKNFFDNQFAKNKTTVRWSTRMTKNMTRIVKIAPKDPKSKVQTLEIRLSDRLLANKDDKRENLLEETLLVQMIKISGKFVTEKTKKKLNINANKTPTDKTSKTKQLRPIRQTVDLTPGNTPIKVITIEDKANYDDEYYDSEDELDSIDGQQSTAAAAAAHPVPDIQAMFRRYDEKYFDGVLFEHEVEVFWINNMYIAAGITYPENRPKCRPIQIKLSRPLLRFAGEKQIRETLLHEMIHAYQFALNISDAHGPEFIKKMHQLNRMEGLSISVYHNMVYDQDGFYRAWIKNRRAREKFAAKQQQ